MILGVVANDLVTVLVYEAGRHRLDVVDRQVEDDRVEHIGFVVIETN
jgi:hypothetical protein